MRKGGLEVKAQEAQPHIPVAVAVSVGGAVVARR